MSRGHWPGWLGIVAYEHLEDPARLGTTELIYRIFFSQVDSKGNI